MAVPALRIVLCATLASLMVLGRPVEAQELARTARITLDNDFLNVWQPPRERADHNYTHGLRLTWDLARAPEFARRLVCTSGACGTTLEIGQEIYTSTLDWFWYVEGERPYAGWLYGRVDVRGGDRATLRRLGLTVGVTGPPSLGEAAHTAVHETFADFKPRVGWVDQLPTEIAFAALASHSWRLVPNGAAARFVDVVPTVAGTLGTLRTSAEAGMRVRLGAPLTHPWLADVRSGVAPYAFAGLRGEAVVRDMFLNGTLFSDSPRTDHRLVFGEVDAGLGVRMGRAALEFRVVRRSRQYAASPSSVTYSSVALEWDIR
jgi:lipid A 3-O-deacylase